MDMLLDVWANVQKNVEKSVGEVGEYLEKQAELRKEHLRRERMLLSRGRTSEVVGHVSLEINGAYRLPPTLRVDISSSDSPHEKTTCSLQTDLFSKCNPNRNAALFTSVPILDPAAQVLLRVYEVPGIPLLPHRYIGAIVLPTSNFIHSKLANLESMTLRRLLHLLFSSGSDSKFCLCGQFQLYPLSEENIRYGSMLEDLVDIGMPRPVESLGLLHIHATLSFKTSSLLHAIISRNPLVPPQKSPADYVWWELIRNIIRVRVAYERVPGPLEAIRLARAWTFPRYSMCVAACFLVLFAWVPFRWMPLSVVLGVGAAQLSIRDTLYKRKLREAKPWKEQAQDPPDKTHTPIGEALKWQVGLAHVQAFLDWTATAMERADNAFSWLDAPVAIVSYSALVAVSLASAGFVYLVEYLWSRVPRPRLSLAVIAVIAMLAPRPADSNSGKPSQTAVPDAIKSGSHTSENGNSKQDETPSRPIANGTEIYEVDSHCEVAWIKSLWDRYALRVPDDRELLHRYICSQQMVSKEASHCKCSFDFPQSTIDSIGYTNAPSPS